MADVIEHVAEADYVTVETEAGRLEHVGDNLAAVMTDLEKRMKESAANLEFEEAARLRDELKRLEEADLGLGSAADAIARPEGRGGAGKGRSTAGRGGTRAWKGKAKGKR